MVISRPRDIEGATAAASVVVQVHEQLVGYLEPGLTLADIDAFVGETIKSLHSRSCFLRYRIPGHPPFPSHSCLSVNDCVVHGTHVMNDAQLVEGDILSVDIGVLHKGWIGDAAWTYAIGAVSEEDLVLLRTGRASLRAGLDAIKPGRPLLDWARAVQQCVEADAGLSLVRGLGGHGYGRSLHGPRPRSPRAGSSDPACTEEGSHVHRGQGHRRRFSIA